MSQPRLGCPLEDLDTPALTIDLDIFEQNIARMAELTRRHAIAWRPHSKAHKSPAIAQLLVAAGAIGVTCAKLGEAEVMAAGGIRDVLIANQLVGPLKMRRLAALCRLADPIVAIDHVNHIEMLGQAMRQAEVQLRVVIEVDLGFNRAGVPPGPKVRELAQRILEQRGLVMAGIMGYEGHLLTIEDPVEKSEKIRQALAELVEAKEMLTAAGLPCPIVSAGGTGSYSTALECRGLTELQAGGLILMDEFYRERCGVRQFGHALKLITTVSSRPTASRAIIDAGRKSQHMDMQPPRVLGYDTIRVVRLSAEHGELELGADGQQLRIGDRLELIPGYSDFTTVMHDEFYGMRNGHLEVIWPLEARGKIR